MTKGEKVLLDSIKSAEGGKLHRNKIETDITTGYGIYRVKHPTASIFSYIDSLAKELGITKPSSEWSDSEINQVNSKIDPEKELELSAEFYKGYFKYSDYTNVPDMLLFSYFNIYVTSTTIAVRAMQSTYNLFIKKFPEIALKPLYGEMTPIKVDGKLGSGTKGAINKLGLILSKENSLYIPALTLIFYNYAKSGYVEIGTDEVKTTGKDKHAIYLKGWDNRVNKLMEDML